MKLTSAYRVIAPTVLACAIATAASAADFSSVDSTDSSGPGSSRSVVTTEIDGAALARAQSKFAHAQRIADQFASSAQQNGLPERWRFEMINALMQNSESRFDQIAANGNLHEAMLAATGAASADEAGQAKSIGDPALDLTYIPLPTPCRIVDTRTATGGPLLANTAQNFTFTSANTSQGGTGCTPFTGYVGGGQPGAAAINITVIGSAGAPTGSFLQAYPQGGSTTTSWLNYGGGQVVANQGILPINQTSAQFTLKSNAQTQAIVDVFGSFVAPAATALSCVTTSENSANVAAGSFNNVVPPACPAGYTATATYCRMGNYTANLSVVSPTLGCGGNASFASSVNASQRCCRVPGR